MSSSSLQELSPSVNRFSSHIIRFLARVRVSDTLSLNGIPCWEWTGAKDPVTGYARFQVCTPMRLCYAHRFAYLYFTGEIPAGYEVDHVCNVRHCCNPLHLEAVTVQENRRRRDARKIACSRGHVFTPETAQIKPNGHRVCRLCNALRARAFRQRHPGYNPAKRQI